MKIEFVKLHDFAYRSFLLGYLLEKVLEKRDMLTKTQHRAIYIMLVFHLKIGFYFL